MQRALLRVVAGAGFLLGAMGLGSMAFSAPAGASPSIDIHGVINIPISPTPFISIQPILNIPGGL